MHQGYEMAGGRWRRALAPVLVACLALAGATFALVPAASATQATLYTGNGSTAVRGIVFDAAHDLIFADTGNGTILELTWNGSSYSSSATTVASGLTNVNGLAIDASGNLFAVLDNGSPNGAVDELKNNGSGGFDAPVSVATGFAAPVGVAINPFTHDLFVASESSGDINEVPWNASTSSYGATTTFQSGFSAPAGIFIDSSGNLFLSDYNAGAVYEYVFNSSADTYGNKQTIVSGLGGQNANYLATDQAHNIFLDETNLGELVEIKWNGSSYASSVTTVETGLSSPVGMGIDAVDNLYTGTGNSMIELSSPLIAQSISFTSSVPTGETVGATTPYTVTATGGASGNPVTFSVDSSSTTGACTISGATVSFNGAGTCVIDANQAGTADYAAAAQVPQSVTVARASQSISFTSHTPTGAATGSTSYTVTASGGASGNPVTFSIDSSSTSGACAISGATVSFTGAGTCLVDANQVGNANYLAASQVQQSIVVARAVQSISFTSLTPTGETVGATTPYTASATGGASGNPVTFSVDSSSTIGACTVSGTTVSFTGAGTCVLDANQLGNANYGAAAQVQQSITVAGAPQSLPDQLSNTGASAPQPVQVQQSITVAAPPSVRVALLVPSEAVQRIGAHGIPVAVECQKATCFGSVNVTVARWSHAGSRGHWIHLVLGRASYRLSSGERTTLKLTMTPLGKAVLRAHLAFWTRRGGRYRMTLTELLTSGPVRHNPVYIRSRV